MAGGVAWEQPACALALAGVGLLVAARAAARLALWLYAAFLRPAKPLRSRYGAWAVVTGATDGIGRALAFRFAAAGLGLVLVGRSPDKLAAVSAEIKARHPGTEARTFVLDFAAEGLAANVDKLREFIRGLDVGVLVNSAGMSYPYARYFHEVDEELMRNLIRLNVEALTRVTHAVLPGMVERKRGAVVNIGSGAASILPSYPLYSIYAATKAYVDQFSRCLYVEYKSKGIDVQCQVMQRVAGNNSPNLKRTLETPTAGPSLKLPPMSPRPLASGGRTTAMAASPPQEQARSAGGDGPVSLFLDTDLGTRLALLVAADSTIRHLKAQVAVEHAAAFPDLGPVAVKSFQVRRKGAMYHLSDSMIVRSAFARVKVGCFLHVKMAAAVADTQCCRDAPAMEDRGRSSEGCLRVDVDRCVRELPATISEIENDVLPQGLEGGEGAAVLNNVHAHDTVPNDALLSSSSQQNTERKKNEAVSLASDVQTNSAPVIDKAKSYRQRVNHDDRTEGAYVNSTYVANVDRSINQSNLSRLGEEAHARKEDVLHGDGDHDVGFVSGNKQVEIKEGMLEETYALDDLSQEKELKRARKTGSFDTSAADPIRETNESEIRGKSDRVLLETNTNSRGELSNSSSQQEVHRNVQEDSIQLENPSIAGKNKKRKRHQSVASKEVVSAQEMTKPSTGAVEVPKAIGEVLLHKDNQGLQGDGQCNVELTSRDKTMIRPSDMLLISSQLNKGRQGTKDVQLVSNAQATTDLVADQGNIELVHKGSRNPTIGDTVNSISEVVGGEEKSTKGSNAPWDGGEKHARKKQAIDDDGCHDEGVVETVRDMIRYDCIVLG